MTNLNFKISNIKCNNLHSILKPQQKKDNQIFFALLIIINKIEQDIIFGIGLNPNFFSKISATIKGISFSELQSSFIEIYIFEIQNIKSFQVSNESVKTKKYLDFLCKKARFYSGIKIDLLSVLFGSENYDFSLMTLSIPLKSSHKKEALLFSEFLTNEENQLTFSKLTGVLPCNKLTLENIYFKEQGKVNITEKARIIGANQLSSPINYPKQTKTHKEIINLNL